jgi:hypothetical protein
MIAAIVAGIQLALLLLTKWFAYKDERKEEVRALIKEIPNAKDPSTITMLLDRINRL